MASKGRPFRTVLLDGWEVLIGRGDEENDELTFRVARPSDLWLHVGGGTPGSHVVIKNPDGDTVPKEVVARAAQLAAWYSKARNASQVEVHVCRAADVKKPRGVKRGTVTISRERRLRVRPELVPGDGGEVGGEADE